MQLRTRGITGEQVKSANNADFRYWIDVTHHINRSPARHFHFGYIYALEEPNNSVVRYVGQTLYLSDRLGIHLTGEKGHSKVLRKWFEELSLEGLVPRMRVLRMAPVACLIRIEKELIEKFSRNGCLLNVTHHPTNKPQRQKKSA